MGWLYYCTRNMLEYIFIVVLLDLLCFHPLWLQTSQLHMSHIEIWVKSVKTNIHIMMQIHPQYRIHSTYSLLATASWHLYVVRYTNDTSQSLKSVGRLQGLFHLYMEAFAFLLPCDVRSLGAKWPSLSTRPKPQWTNKQTMLRCEHVGNHTCPIRLCHVERAHTLV